MSPFNSPTFKLIQLPNQFLKLWAFSYKGIYVKVKPLYQRDSRVASWQVVSTHEFPVRWLQIEQKLPETVEQFS